MLKPSIPLNEKARLLALQQYDMQDAGTAGEFENLALLASEICQTPISLVTIIDEDKQLFKAGTRLPVNEISRELAFCSHAINNPQEVFTVADMRTDIRFEDHPFVRGEPNVVFYTGVPLTNKDGFALGTLCVLDTKPRTLSETQIASLKILAGQVMQLMELRKANRDLKGLRDELEFRNDELQQFAHVVSHDIKSPLASIVLTGEMLREGLADPIDPGNEQLLGVLNRAAYKIKNLVDGVLAYYLAERAMREAAEQFLLKPFLELIIELLRVGSKPEIVFPEQEAVVFANRVALEQILTNLLQNALKYNDQEIPRVLIRFAEDETDYHFVISDNGRGIDEKKQEKILELFTTPGIKDRFGTQGNGIGLSTVKKLVEKMAGTVALKSTPGHGSIFSFSVKKQPFGAAPSNESFK